MQKPLVFLENNGNGTIECFNIAANITEVVHQWSSASKRHNLAGGEDTATAQELKRLGSMDVLDSNTIESQKKYLDSIRVGTKVSCLSCIDNFQLTTTYLGLWSRVRPVGFRPSNNISCTRTIKL